MDRRTFLFRNALTRGALLAAFAAWRSSEEAEAAVAAVAGLPGGSRVWMSAPRSGPVRGVPIRKFGIVAPGCLYRGGQPGGEGYRWLIEQGFRGIVCLRKEHPCEEEVRRLGIACLYLPIPNEHAPTDEQAYRFLCFVRDPDHWPVFVHCAAGEGRTGTLVALARYAIDGWSMSAARHEARRYRPLGFPLFGEQKRWLNRWKDRYPPGSFHPSRPLPGRLWEAGGRKEGDPASGSRTSGRSPAPDPPSAD